MSRLIAVSNRVTPPSTKGAGSQGGLALALGAALRQYRGIWLGWSGHTTPEFSGQLTIQRTAGVTLATVDLEEQDVQEYYNGYANMTLWPLFHHRIDLTAYDRSFGSGYERVNRRFAEVLAPLVEPDDLIWVHDYHLIPLAKELRKRGVKNPIGFFLHIPWPARQLLVTLPRHQRLVQSLFEYDLVGFHTDEWLDAFHGYVTKEAGGQVLADGRVRAFGRTIRARAFPIGIDAEDFAAIAGSTTAKRSWERMIKSAQGRAMIVGVDRLDYSKGLEERFHGYERFLADNPDLQKHVFLLQIAPPTREDVEEYQEIRLRLEALTGRINGAYSDVDWSPIRYVNQGFRRDELAGVYRAARVGLVTPLRDGMNLVAKEYVAAQDPEDPGVLVLSRFAGAARQMREALIVNPYSQEDLSDALKQGLAMPLEERVARWKALMGGVMRDDVVAWRNSFVDALTAVREAPLEELEGLAAPVEPRSFAPDPASAALGLPS
ncbi:alpha,alpha-trehalose-phosphate synthase (UDP-forming) [Caulobacter sp. 17J65-9]|uniref:alpha,alpha-trehalose-phosphate synthase (UDP-forming) n=1 Tax=Caulobacter sp. 17J65-9 TaxID=2709382 RepID=UPI0013C726DD|nr:alpha,alpha-trehalose-phosphate synthase (UDP-forming) [Caulobacter sp. 17J65-9]NEX93924.1 alpha,alpha-trehalose-phosphate synthase (UDP-forming) [Caulobacter sp. 17J65-9]